MEASPTSIGGAGRSGAAPEARPARPLDKKGNKNTPEGETSAQRARRLRRRASQWMADTDHAVKTCGGFAGWGVETKTGRKAVVVRKGRYGAFFGNQVTCGSVSACPVCASKIARDITQSKESQARIQYLAHYDSLTGLPNRILLADRMKNAIANAARYSYRFALLFVDLDRFKQVNDSPSAYAS